MLVNVSASSCSPQSRKCCNRWPACYSWLWWTLSRPWVHWRIRLPRRMLRSCPCVLRQEVRDLKATADHLEQNSPRASIRLFCVPEETPGSSDDKLLAMWNGVMKVQPPLQLDEIEVSHRVGRLQTVQGEFDEAPVVKPRAIIIKFVSRHTKARVMGARKELRKTGQRPAADRRSGGALRPASHSATDEEPHNDATSEATPEDPAQVTLSKFPPPVYISDDLTRTRAKLAFQARQFRNNKRIQDTWVVDSKIMIKDNNNRISKVNRPEDLHEFQWYLILLVCS